MKRKNYQIHVNGELLATKHAWNNVTTDYGKDYLSRIRVYAENSYLPTEYPWFWTSTISTLSREHMYIKEGRYSLRVDYPNSSGVDRVDFLEGDHFGWDENWSIKDTLSFWWYISDLANLYIDEGGFGFGCLGKILMTNRIDQKFIDLRNMIELIDNGYIYMIPK